MIGPLQIRIYEKQQLVYDGCVQGPVEIGRQAEGEYGPYALRQTSGHCRLIVARLDEDTVSRKHILLEPLPDGLARLTNQSVVLPVHLSDGSELPPKTSREVGLPVTFAVASLLLRVQEAKAEAGDLQALAEPPTPPGQSSAMLSRFPTLAMVAAPGPGLEATLRWLHAATSVFQSAASSAEFFDLAVQAVVDQIGLDTGQVVLWDQGDLKVEALRSSTHVHPRDTTPSRHVLNKVRTEKRTFWQVLGHNDMKTPSLAGVSFVVAAPILNKQGQVIGALYGDRRRERPAQGATDWTRLEAMLLELLASGVAGGLARLEQEHAALSARIQFEQFFTPRIVAATGRAS